MLRSAVATTGVVLGAVGSWLGVLGPACIYTDMRFVGMLEKSSRTYFSVRQVNNYHEEGICSSDNITLILVEKSS